MGPRSFNRGNKWAAAIFAFSTVLQWGRGLSTAEISGSSLLPTGPRGASMGPRSFNRGNPQGHRQAGRRLPGFNGAAVFQPRKLAGDPNPDQVAEPLQWGRGLSTAEIWSAPACSCGASRLQWGRGLSTAEMRLVDALPVAVIPASMGPRSFNRGNPEICPPAHDGLEASMGPRSFNRGNAAAHHMDAMMNSASMGPRSFNRGNVRFPTKTRAEMEQLQWGRGLSTAEMRNYWRANDGPRPASMGPRSFNRGNTGDRSAATNTGEASMGPRSFNRGNNGAVAWSPASGQRLQWGRGLSTAEIRSSPRSSSMKVTLQWGRGLSTAEIARPSIGPALQRELQWGRGLSTAEMTATSSSPSSTTRLQWGRGLSTAEMVTGCVYMVLSFVASMGPRSFNRGNPCPGRGSRARYRASMGPRSFNRGNTTIANWQLVAVTSFNGAAVFQPRKCRTGCRRKGAGYRLQWGRGLSTAEMRSTSPRSGTCCPGFNGAAVFQPRKFRGMVSGLIADIGFNGAAVFQPRKSRHK